MGSSLRVTPAADMPVETAKNGSGNIVVVNLQKTPLDSMAALVIHAKCDDVMEKVMAKLGRQIPSWQMKRRVRMTYAQNDGSVSVTGVDSNGAPYELFQKMLLNAIKTKLQSFPNTKSKM